MIGLYKQTFLVWRKIWSLNIWTEAAKDNFSQASLIVLYWFSRMHTRGFKASLPLIGVNECDSSRGISNAFTNTKPASSHREWYTDNLNVCSPLIIPFTTSLYWIIHLHTDWDQQQKCLVCGWTSMSLERVVITPVSWVWTEHELQVEQSF